VIANFSKMEMMLSEDAFPILKPAATPNRANNIPDAISRAC